MILNLLVIYFMSEFFGIMIREYGVAACIKCGSDMYVEIIDWNEEDQELIFDYTTCYCTNGCTNYAIDRIEITRIIEVET